MNAGVPRRNVVIFGGSAYKPGEAAFDDSEALGHAIARRGWTVVNGAYDGTMLASSRGAAAEGGEVIGVTCRIFKSPPNEFLTREEGSDDLYGRMRRLIELGDAYIAMPGSTGTLAELALVWEMINKCLIPVRPILCWGDYWRPIVQVFEADTTQDPRVNTLGITERRGDLIDFVNTPEEAVAALERHWRQAAG